jgi:choline transport protein
MSLIKPAQQLDIILGERPDICEATDELAMEEKKVESPKE